MRSIVRFSKLIYERGYVTSNQGNLSQRIQGGHFQITPSGIPKSMVLEDNIITVDIHGRVIKGTAAPSMETSMHLGLYAALPNINAIIHAHPVHTTALTLKGVEIDLTQIPEGGDMLGDVPAVKYYPAGSADLAAAAASAAYEGIKAMILCRHGVIAFGEDLLSAYINLERLEYVCRLLYLAKTGAGG